MIRFEELELHLRDLYLNNSSYVVGAFKPTFRTFFGEEHQTFRLKMLHNLDRLRLQFERYNLHEVNAKTCLEEPKTYSCDLLSYLDILERLIDKTRIKRLIDQTVVEYDEFQMKDYEVKTIKETKKPLNEAIHHEHEIEKIFKLQSKDVQINSVQAVDVDLVVTKSSGIELKNNSSENALSKSVNETQMHMQEGKVDMESSGTKSEEHDTSSMLGKYTDTEDAVIRPVNDQEPLAEAQIQEKLFANVALKNKLRKLKGNSANTKFAKPSILGKSVLQPPKNQSVVRQPNAFKSKRPNFSKPHFASQVDVNNVLSKPVTSHYLPKVQEYVIAKPHHVIASGSSRNSSKESYGSNDMAHNYYLEKAKKKTQDENMNLKPSVMHTTSLQNTTNGRKPKPRSNNQTSRSLPIFKSSYGMSNGVPLVDHSRNSSSFSDS
nr:hypothetical protein [Tanacetum cinerariifolium]